MSEENKEEGYRVKPLEVKPGGKENGTRLLKKMEEPDKENEE